MPKSGKKICLFKWKLNLSYCHLFSPALPFLHTLKNIMDVYVLYILLLLHVGVYCLVLLFFFVFFSANEQQ